MLKKLLISAILVVCTTAYAEDAIIKTSNDSYILGDLDIIKGPEVAVAPVYTAGENKKSRNAVNYVFINLATGDSQMLSKTNNQVFMDREEVSDGAINPQNKAEKKGKSNVKANIYSVITFDSDKDGKITENDKVSIAASSASGGGYVILSSGIDEIYDIDSSKKGRAVVIYKKEGRFGSAVIDANKLKIVKDAPLPILLN